MGTDFAGWAQLEQVTWQHVALALVVLALAIVLSTVLRRALRRAADAATPRWRLGILRALPVTKLAIGLGTTIVIVPIFVEPTFANAVTLLASVGLALAFALKDYASSLVAGVLIVVEGAFQPGDWITMAGVYGEVKSIELRATRLVTPDDTEVTIPHSRIWSAGIANATSGNRGLLCVTSFYLHPEHDSAMARAQLGEIAESSPYWLPATDVSVIVEEKPWGTQYRLKAYVKDSRDQFRFMSDLTVRGKGALTAMNFRFAQAPYAAGGAA